MFIIHGTSNVEYENRIINYNYLILLVENTTQMAKLSDKPPHFKRIVKESFKHLDKIKLVQLGTFFDWSVHPKDRNYVEFPSDCLS